MFADHTPPPTPDYYDYAYVDTTTSGSSFNDHLSPEQDTTEDLLAQVYPPNLWNTTVYCEPVVVNQYDPNGQKSSFQMRARDDSSAIILRPVPGGYYNSMSGISSFPITIQQGNGAGTSVQYYGFDANTGAQVNVQVNSEYGYPYATGRVTVNGQSTNFQRACQMGR